MNVTYEGLAAAPDGPDRRADDLSVRADREAQAANMCSRNSGKDRHSAPESDSPRLGDEAGAARRSDPACAASAEFTFSRRIVCLSDPDGAAAASYRSLQTHLLARHVGEGRRGLAVCSPRAGTGCTTVAVNLAAACAQAGINTLLVDANLSRPAVHDFIRPPSGTGGLVQMLSATPADHMDEIRRDVRPNLSVLFAGGASARAHDLVAQRRFKDVIDHCMRSFDLTIVDLPARSSDARQIAITVRHAMMVTRRHVTLLADVKAALAELASDRVRVVGSFLNDF